MSGPGRVVDQTVRIAARPAIVWRFWTEPARMAEWWGEARLDPQPGGAFVVRLDGGGVMRGEYVELVPHERIVFTFGWEPTDGAPNVAPGSTRVEVSFQAVGDETVVRVRHGGIPRADVDHHGRGWEHFLDSLRLAASDATGVCRP